MAESVVSLIVEHIGNLIEEESSTRLSDVGSQAEAVCVDLGKIEELLVKAQQNTELANSEQVRSCLGQLRRIAYDAEDVVDAYYSENEFGISFLFSSLRLGVFWNSRAHQASEKLRMLRKKIQVVKKGLETYEIKGSRSSREGMMREHRSQSSKGHHPDDFVVGIETHVEQAVKMLVAGGDDINVLGIIGMGGSGKTTLARTIYYHRKVRRHFKCLAWVTPMKGWDTSEMAIEILRQIDCSHKLLLEGQSSSELKRLLEHTLFRKTCLVVLDDVWEWESFREVIPALFSGIHAIKVVITSRQRFPLSNTNFKVFFHETQLLNEEDSWYLFKKVSMSDSGTEIARDCCDLAMEMLRKCKGLPLAIVEIGKLVKTKNTIQEWERVFSQLVGKEGRFLYRPVNDILALSYDDLNYYLQPCFLYFGLFQEDSTISAGKLMRMWIAEGFVQRQCRKEETLEDAARRLLQKLIDNTMVQVVKRTYGGKLKTLRIHNIMRDLCIMKAQELDFLTVCSPESYHMSQQNSRRAAISLRKLHGNCLT